MTNRVLDHHPGEHYDPASRGFGVARKVEEVPTRGRHWVPPRWFRLDQGDTPHCGGHGSVNDLLSSPVRVKEFPNGRTPMQYAHDYYYLAKDWQLDPWGREEGTSSLAMAKVGQRLGYWESYYWSLETADDVKRGLELGPGLLGCSWFTGMFEPDVDGRIRATGWDEGGHFVCINGWTPNYRRKGPHIRILQSWGPNHGKNGLVYLPLEDLATVTMGHLGEIFFPVKRSFGG